MSENMNVLLEQLKLSRITLEQTLENKKSNYINNMKSVSDEEHGLVNEINELINHEDFIRIENSEVLKADYTLIVNRLKKISKMRITKCYEELDVIKEDISRLLEIKQSINQSNIAYIKESIGNGLFNSLEQHLTDKSFLDYLENRKK